MILKILIFLIIIYYLLKLFGQIFLPLFVTHRIQKMEEEKEQRYRDYISQKRKEEGKVTVESKTNPKKDKDPGKGEYIDYEEIK